MNSNEIADNDLTLFDVVDFLREQAKTIVIVFVTLFVIVCSFVLTRPTQYESRADLLIGTNYYFIANPNPNPNPNPNQIEPAEQIKYLYSAKAQIVPIKNTSIVQVVVKNKDEAIAEQEVKETINLIVKQHEKLASEKKADFIKLIEVTKVGNANELVGLIDSASLSKMTRQVSPISTTTLPYSGMLAKGMGIGLLGSLICALLFAFLRQKLQQFKLNQ